MKTCAGLLGAEGVEPCLVDTICRILTHLLDWEVGLIYLCEEEQTSAVWKQLVVKGSSEFVTYFAHCLEVSNSIHFYLHRLFRFDYYLI
jgi:hypothetical protein